MVERLSRDSSKQANDDVAEVVYNMADERTSVTCHREDSKISATTRHFVKPALTDDKGDSGVVWNVDSYSAFLVSLSLSLSLWPRLGVPSSAICVSCLSVCSLSYLKNHTSKFH